MKVCVVGAGGVGGLLAAVLRRAGVDVGVLVTERHVKAIRSNGLALIAPGGRFSVEIQAELDPRAIGACDVVVVTAKMWALEALAPTLEPLLGENTAVIPVQNGIDAPGILAKALGWEHVVYGSASMNAAIEEPGVIRQKNPQYGFTVAEAQGKCIRQTARGQGDLRGCGCSGRNRHRWPRSAVGQVHRTGCEQLAVRAAPIAHGRSAKRR